MVAEHVLMSVERHVVSSEKKWLPASRRFVGSRIVIAGLSADWKPKGPVVAIPWLSEIQQLAR